MTLKTTENTKTTKNTLFAYPPPQLRGRQQLPRPYHCDLLRRSIAIDIVISCITNIIATTTSSSSSSCILRRCCSRGWLATSLCASSPGGLTMRLTNLRMATLRSTDTRKRQLSATAGSCVAIYLIVDNAEHPCLSTASTRAPARNNCVSEARCMELRCHGPNNAVRPLKSAALTSVLTTERATNQM